MTAPAAPSNYIALYLEPNKMVAKSIIIAVLDCPSSTWARALKKNRDKHFEFG